MKKRTILIAVFFLMAAFLMTACQNQEMATASDVAVIALQGKNMPMADAAVAETYFSSAAAADGSSVSLIIADGKPGLAGDVIHYGVRQAKNDVHWKQELQERCQQAETLLETSVSQEAETDLLRAFELASRQLASGSGENKILLIYHSGLNSCAPLPMQKMDLAALGAETVETLEEQGYLPDLNGCTVEWYFLGDTAGEQATLEEWQVEKIRTFWETYLRKSGASAVTFHSDLPSADQAKDAPPVSTVPVQAVSVEPVKLGNDMLKFLPDSDQVADETAALQQLGELAETLKATDVSYVLAGLTADVDQTSMGDSQRLGLARAVKARALLEKLGVPHNQLICVGIGTAEAEVRHTTDQSRNRSAWLVPLESSLGAAFLEAGILEQ